MKALLRLIPLVLVILGLIALGLIIWFIGPLLAIGTWRPLESELARWGLIGLIVLFWIFSRILRWWRARRANAQLSRGMVAGKAAPPPPGASEQEVADLARRFEEAVAVLRDVRLSAGGRRPGLRELLSLSGRQYLYQLPWYVFIGAPGSGKTTALINSGLQFPLADRFGTHAIQGVGGTRNCDWWFTDEAVLIDTAGRYTTQESNREVDAAAWQGFLDLLRRSRPRRPLNGVMLTVSVVDLLQESAAERQTHAEKLRTRLQELRDRLQVRLPIYVLVTKADMLAGFSEFFGALSREERTQVWGVTLPLETPRGASPLAGFAAEFDALHQRLIGRVLDRVEEERAPPERAAVFAFPQQLATLRPVLEDFLGKVFASSKFDEAFLLRGIYLTSGTQDGNPIDRVMGSLARAFKLDRRLVPAQPGSGRSYFITRLLRDVIFREQGLVGTNLRLERRLALVRWGTFALAALVLVGACAACFMSYSRNRDEVAAVQARVPAVQKQVESIAPGQANDVLALLPVLNAVRDIALDPRHPDGVPVGMSFGMYQGRKLNAAADMAYRRLLRDTLLPALSTRVEQLLRTANENNKEFAYEALKTYLMLNDPAHFDAPRIRLWVSLDWERNLPRDVPEDVRKNLDAHLDALLDQAGVTSPLPPDQNLVHSIRAMLEKYPLSQRIYSRLKAEGVGTDIPEFTLAKVAGPGAATVFNRISGKPLTRGIPGLFTYKGYYEAFRKASDRVANQLADEEGWVLGLKDASALGRLTEPTARERLIEDVRRLYLEDYANTWDQYLKDIRLVRPGNLQQCIEIARVLSAPDNPLVPFLRAASRETTLLKPEGDKNVIDRTQDSVRGGLKDAEDALKKFLPGGADPRPNTANVGDKIEMIVDRRFEGLRRYVTATANNGPAPIDAVVSLLAQLQTMLNAADTAIKAKMPPPPSPLPNEVKTQAPSMPEPLGPMLATLSAESVRFTAGATKENVDDAIRAAVHDYCVQRINDRYPFRRSSDRDVTQDDFANLFAPGGKMDDAFQRLLADKVDTSTRPWSFRSVNDAQLGSSPYLPQFQNAAVIRDVFFPSGGRAMSLKLEFKPIEMDASILQFTLDVDGQLVKYSHGPQVPQTVQWPGPRGSTQVRIQIDPPGPSGLSGMSTEGAWALFRMLDKAQIAPSSQPERFQVGFAVDGRRAQFEVLANSVANPFRMREIAQFQCP